MSKPTRPLLKRQGAAVLHLHEGKGANLTNVAIGNAPWIAGFATAPTWRLCHKCQTLQPSCFFSNQEHSGAMQVKISHHFSKNTYMLNNTQQITKISLHRIGVIFASRPSGRSHQGLHLQDTPRTARPPPWHNDLEQWKEDGRKWLELPGDHLGENHQDQQDDVGFVSANFQTLLVLIHVPKKARLVTTLQVGHPLSTQKRLKEPHLQCSSDRRGGHLKELYQLHKCHNASPQWSAQSIFSYFLLQRLGCKRVPLVFLDGFGWRWWK